MTVHVFINIKEVSRRTGYGKTKIYRRINSGCFPRQIPDESGRVSWLESEIHEYQQNKINRRDATINQGPSR